ncbi:MAG TPA: DUF4178 domain-containing protein [Longimicrobium sp.]|nr:DUF4178 domain-containing protein [Longimicrobium sp.]
MSGPASQCPSCGAPVEFRWADAVQTVCPFCASVLVRHDVRLERVGKVSAPPRADSRIQLGTRGSHAGRAFTVVGRIAYAWERGGWNEWHLVGDDGTSRWLSEADGELAVTSLIHPTSPLPAAERVSVGDSVEWEGALLRVTETVLARYAGTEGDLPFEYWDRDGVLFADLRSPDGRVATVDYSGAEPLFFAGDSVEWQDLALRDLRETAPSARVEGVRTLRCPSCGGTVAVRAAGHSVSVACGSCGSVLDAADPGLRVLQQFQSQTRHEPRIPLGSRGKLHGVEWEAIGFQVRSVTEEGIEYPWSEYVIFHPERGFRYLTEEKGHWTDAAALRALPEVSGDARPTATVNGEEFKHFATALAATTYVVGEFPWEVRVGDREEVMDFVSPPRMLSREVTAGEEAWSVAEYVAPQRIWDAFRLPGQPPPAIGVYANQPSPHANKSAALVRTFGILLLLFAILVGARCSTAADLEMVASRHTFDPALPEDASSVETRTLVLEGRPASLEVALETDVSDSWAFFNFELVNQETGGVRRFSREVSYYSGVEGGESWNEGDSNDAVRLSAIPAGRYVLRVDPEAERRTEYVLRVRHDVPSFGFFITAFLLLAVPAAFGALAAGSFESERWAESDHAPESDEDESDDESDD